MAYAYQVHHGQRRKGTGIPYIAHILGVTAIAMEYGADEDQSIAALLHDAAEDGGGEATLAEIRARFGDAVADIVLGCSDSLVEDPEDKLPWQARKENYLAHLETRERVGVPGLGRRQAAQRALDHPRLSRARRSDLGSLPGKARRHAVVLTRPSLDTLVRRHRSQLTRDLQRGGLTGCWK